MFEYSNNYFKIIGFTKIEYIDENRMIFVFKKKKIMVIGKRLVALNLSDKSLEIKGIVEQVNLIHMGDISD